MNPTLKKLFFTFLCAGVFLFAVTAFGQEVAEEAAKAPPKATTFVDIVYGDSIINLLIWILLFGTSIGCVAFIIDGIISVKAEKIMPRALADGVRSALEQGDLGAALETCEQMPSPLANILAAGLNNVENGYSVVMDSISSSAEIETEKLMQRISMLSLIGALAPMLGLMGTVVGMVLAFAALANATGAEKATMLSNNISIALYTTLYGLLVSVPSLLGFTFIRNQANKLILTMEVLTYDLIKVLRDAEVVGSE